ncbi:SDR family NAD(P)-dependent oxidoreductase [Glycomyces arizonensis]|uniref:SDR family NAD(P)-dependent oxidoreductase n=1 Tax=Glycomyces arizonensis TaxID=256035 RepID=UPI0004216D77|nr:SDR family NAD(P)-dependent oxidoreductase [Glycomyces arizonensis]
MDSRPVALVTGASSGIGEQIARALAGDGFRVFGTSRRDRADRDGVEMLRLEVTSPESVRSCVERVLDRAGRIDVLVNNAGVMHEGLAEETSIDEAGDVFATDFFGVVRLTDAVLPGMRERGAGRVVNIGSLAAWVGEPGEGFYAAAKAALARYTEALGYEVRPLGISVSLVEPGAFVTPVVEAATASEHAIADYDAIREAARGTLRRGLENGGDPRRVGRLVSAIARARSPRPRYGVGRGGTAIPLLKVLLPRRWFDALLTRAYGLPARTTRQ